MAVQNGSLDANVVLRLITKDIPSQYTAAQTLISDGKMYTVADTTLIETIYALHEYYKIPRALVKEAIQTLYSNKNLSVDDVVFDEALTTFSARPALSIEDCYLAAKAKLGGAMPLWTFDKKLAKQSGGVAQEIGLA